ncbi:MAG: hypothetical protein AAF384_16625 [Pseudomonadota bacterium]
MPLPEDALILRYQGGGNYVDCYRTQVPGSVSLARLITSFYTSPLFKLERSALYVLSLGASDADVHALANGDIDRFSAWTVEAREPDQLLLSDVRARTRSWLKVDALDNSATALFFGSAVLAQVDREDIGIIASSLLGFHVMYSHALLNAARQRLLSGVSQP